MKLSIFIDVALVLVISFFVKQKKLRTLENLLVFMVLEFLVSSYCAILYINIDVWGLAKDPELFIIFRIYEAIVNPFIWLWYFQLLPSMDSRFTKWMVTGAFVGIQWAVEKWLFRWEVIINKDWHFWQCILVQFLVLSITYLSQSWYGKILQKEGSDVQ